jgi:hypothetical protein
LGQPAVRRNSLDSHYAVRYEFDVVRIYADNGKSGLRIDGRDALK